MPTESRTSILSDRLLNGRYRIVSHLGAGGMGKTYIAEDTGRPGNPKCVVKQLKPALPDPNLLPNARRLFNNEAEALERLGHHEQIPRLLAYFEEDEEFFLVQEFVDGHPLSTEMPLGQCWSEPQVIQLLKEVLQILKFVHSQNAIHRDIKPENIIRRTQDRRLVLIDFGAVKQVQMQNATGLGQVSITIGIGTPGYMPTEQSKGTPRPNSDLYALGMVAIQALTGLLPFQLKEDEDGEVIWRNHAEISDRLATFLSNMVRYHFKHRYKSASEALQALLMLTEEPITPTELRVQQVQDAAQEQSYSNTELNPETADTKQPEPDFQVPKTPSATEMFSREASQPADEEEETDPLPTPSSLKHRLAVYGVAIAVGGLLGGGGYLIQQQLERQQQQEQLVLIEQSKRNDDYPKCLELLGDLPRNHSDIAAQAKTLETDCNTAYGRQLLAEAQKVAEGSEFLRAIGIAGEISPETPSFGEAQPLISQWSENVLVAAQNAYETGNLDNAVAWANSIPATNSIYQKAQESIKAWQQEWIANEDMLKAAQDALNNGKWDGAIASLEKLTGRYWQERGALIRARAVDEKILLNAQQLIDNGRWTAAIAEAQKVTTESAKPKATELIKKAEEARYKYLNPIKEEANLTQDMPSRTYTFEGTRGERLRATLSSSEFDTEVRMLDANGVEFAYNDDTGNDSNSTLTFTLPQTGTYTVRVTAFRNSPYRSANFGRFSIHVRRLR